MHSPLKAGTGSFSLASKAVSSVPGPGAFHRRRGHYLPLFAANVGGSRGPGKALDGPLSDLVLPQALPQRHF